MATRLPTDTCPRGFLRVAGCKQLLQIECIYLGDFGVSTYGLQRPSHYLIGHGLTRLGVVLFCMANGVGPLLRRWREARHLSQLELALEAEVSARHLSFLETGRANPSREMLLTLANVLDVPLRERNVLLLAAGYAPIYAETSLNDPRMSQYAR